MKINTRKLKRMRTLRKTKAKRGRRIIKTRKNKRVLRGGEDIKFTLLGKGTFGSIVSPNIPNFYGIIEVYKVGDKGYIADIKDDNKITKICSLSEAVKEYYYYKLMNDEYRKYNDLFFTGIQPPIFFKNGGNIKDIVDLKPPESLHKLDKEDDDYDKYLINKMKPFIKEYNQYVEIYNFLTKNADPNNPYIAKLKIDIYTGLTMPNFGVPLNKIYKDKKPNKNFLDIFLTKLINLIDFITTLNGDGYYHCDIKAENILCKVGEDGESVELKLIDLGWFDNVETIIEIGEKNEIEYGFGCNTISSYFPFECNILNKEIFLKIKKVTSVDKMPIILKKYITDNTKFKTVFSMEVIPPITEPIKNIIDDIFKNLYPKEGGTFNTYYEKITISDKDTISKDGEKMLENIYNLHKKYYHLNVEYIKDIIETMKKYGDDDDFKTTIKELFKTRDIYQLGYTIMSFVYSFPYIDKDIEDKIDKLYNIGYSIITMKQSELQNYKLKAKIGELITTHITGGATVVDMVDNRAVSRAVSGHGKSEGHIVSHRGPSKLSPALGEIINKRYKEEEEEEKVIKYIMTREEYKLYKSEKLEKLKEFAKLINLVKRKVINKRKK